MYATQSVVTRSFRSVLIPIGRDVNAHTRRGGRGRVHFGRNIGLDPGASLLPLL